MARFSIKEEYEHFLHCEVIENNFAFLCDNINPSDHVDFLRSERIFDQETVEDIMSQTTTRQRCRTFLGYLKRRGHTAFQIFVKSLMKNRTQVFIVKRLNVALEDLKNHPPVSIAERKPRPSDDEIISSRVLDESDTQANMKNNNREIPKSIEKQLPIPGQPGAIPLPVRPTTQNNNEHLPSSSGKNPSLIAHQI
ncbi:uncharacterized protein [Antedon mediterranea]|uniref:uncharacterized protein n=1 Tax=Antedon mediterranea TaxID=105859 RepID=UPI003AF7F9F9